jgi:hypothetical protein
MYLCKFHCYGPTQYPANDSHTIVFWMRNSGTSRSILNMDEVIHEISDFDVKYVFHKKITAVIRPISGHIKNIPISGMIILIIMISGYTDIGTYVPISGHVKNPDDGK